MSALQALQLTVVGLLVASSAVIAGASATDSATVSEQRIRDIENPDGNVTILRGSHTLADALGTHQAVARARAKDKLRQPQYLVPGYLLVLQFESARISNALAARTGPTPTARFFRLLNQTDASFAITEIQPGASQQYTKLRLNRSNVAVLHDPASASISILVDTQRTALVARHDGEPVDREYGGVEFQAVVKTPDENGQRVLAGNGRFQDPYIGIRSPSAGVYFQETVPPTITQNRTSLRLAGTTSLLPNTTITVLLRQDGQTVVTTETVTQDRNHSDTGFGPAEFTTTVEGLSLAPDDRFTLVVRHANATVDRQPVVVGKPAMMRNTTARIVRTGPHAGDVRVNTTVRVPAPGFLTVRVNTTLVTASIPADRRVRRTLYVDPAAINQDTGRILVSAQWDQDRDGSVGSSDDTRLFRTPLDVGTSSRDTLLGGPVKVANWTPASPTSTPEATETTETQTGTTGAAGPGFGMVTVVLSAGFLSARLFVSGCRN